MTKRREWTWLAAGAAMLAACSSGSDGGTGPAVVTTVEVSVASAMLVSDTAVAVATVKDQNGNIMAGQTVTWSSDAGAVAAVSGSGVVSAASTGSATISASVAGKSGNVTVVVGTDARFGYAWANDPAAASYTPNGGYVHNSSGGAITIARSGTGVYAVTFSGLGASGAQRTGVQVSAYSAGSSYCKTAGWNTSGANFVVNVKCFAVGGAAADARYTVLLTGATAVQGRLGFAFGDNAAAATSIPTQTRSSRGLGIRSERTSAGVYKVTFDGLVRGGTDSPEQVMVTAVGDGSERCTVGGWSSATFYSWVYCYDALGAPADSRYSILIIEKGRTGRKLAFAWANEPSSPVYSPSSGYLLNDGGGLTEITRTGIGVYSVSFAGLDRSVGATETVLIAAYGGPSMCRIGSWGGAFTVSVYCYDAAGAAVDSRFDVVVVQ